MMIDQDNDDDNNPWNISNDKYYRPLPGALERLAAIEDEQIWGSHTIRHAIPALDLWRSCFPTYMNEERLRTFHRPRLKKFLRGGLADSNPQGVKCLTRYIVKHHRELRNNIINSIKAGWSRERIIKTHLVIMSAKKLTPKYGELLLFEYSEEHPPLLSQIGMASNIRNYFWPKSDNQKFTPLELKQTYEHGFSEVVQSGDKAFLGKMKPGHSLQAIVNNMYRAPIFRHNMPECDFLVLRSRNSYYIRTVETIFTVGQEMPLIEVPYLNPTKFWSELWDIHIQKMFLRSIFDPKRIRHRELMKLFPYDSKKNVHRRMKKMSVFEMSSGNDGFWILLDKDNKGVPIRLSKVAQLRKRLRPEQCCAYYSMMAAEQRLKDAGYNSVPYTPKHENDEKSINDLEDEVKAAPWNTTKSFIAAQEGKCYLDLQSHVVDPTGTANEGFSYVRINRYSNSINGFSGQQLNSQQPGNLQSQSQGNRTSTPLVKRPRTSHSPFPSFKNHQYNQARRKESLERLAEYNKQCQYLFDIQNKVLASAENLSSDECSDSSSDELDGSLEQNIIDLKEILLKNKSATDFNHEKEEEERIALKKSLLGVPNGEKKDKVNGNQSESSIQHSPNLIKQKRFLNVDEGDRILKIVRSYQNDDGTDYNRLEIVRRPAVIDLYIQMKNKSKQCSGPDKETQGSGDNPHTASMSLSTPSLKTTISLNRRKSLEEGELMKVEGTKCVFSKKLLKESRSMRTGPRKNYNYGPP